MHLISKQIHIVWKFPKLRVNGKLEEHRKKMENGRKHREGMEEMISITFAGSGQR